jgi:hypothetical protein
MLKGLFITLKARLLPQDHVVLLPSPVSMASVSA